MSTVVQFVRVGTEGKTAYGRLTADKIDLYHRAPWLGGEPSGKAVPLRDCQLLAPVEPTKIICIGLNYRAHVAASQSTNPRPEQPLIFFKPPSSVIATKQNIIYPAVVGRLDYEAELGVVIGKTAKDVREGDALEHVFGWTCVNDVTARDLQKSDGQWARAKGFDTFCPVGPWIIPRDALDYTSLKIEGILNGKVMQSGNTSDMIFSVPFLVSYISSIMTLQPGDLIATGTPAGIAPMQRGDTIEVRISQIGTLRNVVA